MNSLIHSLAVAIDILNKGGKIYIVQRGTKDYRIDIEPLKKADLVIVFNPWDNQNLILEAHRRAIPIIAQTDIYSQSQQNITHKMGKTHNANQIRKYITYPVSILSLELINSYIQFLYRFEKKKTHKKMRTQHNAVLRRYGGKPSYQKMINPKMQTYKKKTN